MIGTLRTLVKRLGAVAAAFALLVIASPSLASAACAGDGCGAFCIEEGVTASPAEAPADDCAETHCVCSIGHCCHAHAGIPQAIDGGAAVSARVLDRMLIETEPLVSALPDSLERPPRV